MHLDEIRQYSKPSGIEWSFTWFMRILALILLACGVYYWVRLIGLRPGLLWRFDLMPWPWRAATVALAILLPVAATGLWMRAPWGPVLWFVAALGEIAIYSVLSRYFAYRPWLVGFNAACLVVYLGFRVALFLEKRRQARDALPGREAPAVSKH